MSELLYNLRLVAKSLRRDRWFTLVMVLSQALGVSIFVTALVSAQRYSNVTGQVNSDVFRVEGEHSVALARFFRGTQFEGVGEFTGNYVSLATVRTLAATGLATASTVNFVSVMTGGPVERPPARLPVRFCDADIFQLFNIDFRYGGAFTGVAGTSVAGTGVPGRPSPAAAEVVLSDMLNQQLYGGADSVGRMVRIAGRDFRVVGVMRQRSGKMNLWDFGVAPENIANLLVPSAFAGELRPVPVYSWPLVLPELGWRGIADSKSGVTEYWVRVPPGEARTRYAAALAGIDPRLSLRSADEIARPFLQGAGTVPRVRDPDAGRDGGERHQPDADAARQGDLARRRDRDSPRARRRTKHDLRAPARRRRDRVDGRQRAGTGARDSDGRDVRSAGP